MTSAKQAFLDALELERFTIPTRPELTTDHVRGWTPEEQAEHRQALLDALSSDRTVVAWREAAA